MPWRKRPTAGTKTHRGHEERPYLEATVRLNFRHVLVGQAEGVDPERRVDVVGRVGLLEALDQLAPASAVAGDRVDRDRVIRRQQAARHQGAQQGHRGERVAPRVGDPFGRADARRLPAVQFRKAINPVRIGPVRRGGIDDPQRRVLDQSGGLPRRLVGQAENRQVGPIEHPGPPRGVFPLVFRQAQELHIAAPGQPRADLQASGAHITVDENFCDHGSIHLETPYYNAGPVGATLARDAPGSNEKGAR
jgi:hypothetical protein